MGAFSTSTTIPFPCFPNASTTSLARVGHQACLAAAWLSQVKTNGGVTNFTLRTSGCHKILNCYTPVPYMVGHCLNPGSRTRGTLLKLRPSTVRLSTVRPSAVLYLSAFIRNWWYTYPPRSLNSSIWVKSLRAKRAVLERN